MASVTPKPHDRLDLRGSGHQIEWLAPRRSRRRRRSSARDILCYWKRELNQVGLISGTTTDTPPNCLL